MCYKIKDESVLTDDEPSGVQRHAYTASCLRQFDHIVGDLLFSAPTATVIRNENVEFLVRLGNVVRGVLTTIDFSDGSAPVDNVTLIRDDNAGRDDLSAHYRYRAVVSHRFSCAARYDVQLAVSISAARVAENYSD